MNKLVIIGNGFDLRLNLKSSFDDFFRTDQLSKVEHWLSNPNDLTSIKKVNYISILLYYTSIYALKNPRISQGFQAAFQDLFKFTTIYDWKDVEGFIEKILNNSTVKYAVDTYNMLVNHVLMDKNYFLIPGDCLLYYINEIIPVRGYKEMDYYNFVFQELQLFEKDFVDYLFNEVSHKDTFYSTHRPELMRSIIQPYNSNIVILNFNYTSLGSLDFPEINIHGKLVDKNIIIGIDFKENRNLNVLPFTKTYRKLLSTKDSIVLDKQFDEIVIYGHSLGKQDYSYFQSIFDYVNLYSGKTVVKYIYSDYYLSDTLEKENLKKEKANQLFTLIEEYGNTLDNKDNGKNLLHKLLLEGRIKLELNNYDDVFADA